MGAREREPATRLLDERHFGAIDARADELAQRRRGELRRPEVMRKECGAKIVHDAFDHRARRERARPSRVGEPLFACFGERVDDTREACRRRTSGRDR